MGKLRYYLKEENYENVLKVEVENEVDLALFIQKYSEFADTIYSQNIVSNNGIIAKGTMFFLDKNNGCIVVRLNNKDILLISGHESLLIEDKRQYIYKNDLVSFESDKIDRDIKKECFDKITNLMGLFKGIDKYLPIDSTTAFMFNKMGLLDMSRVSVVAEDENILLCLRDFRKNDPEWMELIIADSYTYEVVGSIEFSLNKRNESNFSYSGNVKYNICDSHSNKGYATCALALLKSYIKDLSDEYNKVLYVASIVDDLSYQQVAIKNGGVLEYDGNIPAGESLKSLSKVDEIKIYRIDV